ncbi:MAG: DNA mismatch repair protein MutH [Verrucomicrobiota bacterium]|nr:DNA mismatch repair protein MutH [Verrucomicrobiota bacterium]
MKVEVAIPLLQQVCNVPFRNLFIRHPEDLRTNKGNVGQLLLNHIGLTLDNSLCDFEDGELKTNKALPCGEPCETMFITQISRIIDSMITAPPKPFAESNLYNKIRNLIYLPVVKDSIDVGDWYFVKVIHLEAKPDSTLYKLLEEDYYSICKGLQMHIENSRDGFIHTTNGTNLYLQIRSKDSKPYRPVYSTTYGKSVSNKNHAFYFRKEFMRDALRGVFS